MITGRTGMVAGALRACATGGHGKHAGRARASSDRAAHPLRESWIASVHRVGEVAERLNAPVSKTGMEVSARIWVETDSGGIQRSRAMKGQQTSGNRRPVRATMK